MQAGVEAAARFVQENREIDQAWANGTLGEWIDAKIDREKRGFHADAGGGTTADGDTGGVVIVTGSPTDPGAVP